MILSRPQKITLGVASFGIIIIPLVMVLVFIGFFGSLLFFAENIPPQYFETLLPAGLFGIMFFLQCFLGILTLGLQGFYLYHLIKNKNQDNDILRVMLAVGFFLLPFLAIPIYYIIFIWPDPKPEMMVV